MEDLMKALLAALLIFAFTASTASAAPDATCTISNAQPVIGEVVTISADGLHAGGSTHIYVQESNATYDLFNQGSVDTFTFNWAFGSAGPASVLFTTEQTGVVKCEIDLNVTAA
jgi:hypothetical protein